MGRKSRNDPPQDESGETLSGRVMAVYTDKFRVWVNGDEIVCSTRSRFSGIKRAVVGDFVSLVTNSDGSGTITGLEPRQNTLERKAVERRPPQVMAANIDLLVIVSALDAPPFRPALAERLLVASDMAGFQPLLCISKTDLDANGALEKIVQGYSVRGVDVVTTQQGIYPQGLAEALKKGTSILVGHSGVGKTSLINTLSGKEMAVGEVDLQRGRGRHTTTTARLIPLEAGGFVIDSPGVREFGLSGVGPEDLAQRFSGWADLFPECGFRNCLHKTEPRCRVRAAVDAGEVPEAHYQIYRGLLEELEEQKEGRY